DLSWNCLFFSRRRRHTRSKRDWSSDVCSSDLTHSILQRMNELAVQSSNDTNMDDVDREAMQAEMDALIEEIDDIAGRTEFNTQNLLGGEFKDKVFHIGANKGQ